MTMPNYLSQPQPWPPRKKPRIWPLALGGLAIVGVLFVGCTAMVASSVETTSSPTTVRSIAPAVPITYTTLPPQITTTTTEPTPAGPASTIRKDGVYLVGVDIVAGTYRTDGGNGCYWERLSALTGGLGAIIANENGKGQQIVTIAAGDKAFSTKRCGTWTLIPE